MSDPELIATLPLAGVRWVVSTIREHAGGVGTADPRLALIHALRDHGFRGRVAVTSGGEGAADAQLRGQVDLVLEPFQDAADRAVELLESNERPVRLETAEPEEQKEIGA